MKKPNKSNIILLDAIRPNWSIEQHYIKLLYNLTGIMTNEVEVFIHDTFMATDPYLPLSVRFNKISPKVNQRLEKWQVIFNKHSSKYANDFVKSTDEDVQRQLKATFKKNISDDLVIKFDQGNQNSLAKAQGVIKANIDLITDIPDKMKEKLQFALNESMQQGRNYKYFKEQVINITDVTEKRAELIARDQSFKATSAISLARQSELGITKQAWFYTNISKEPRLSHKAANGKVYDIDKGCLIDGEYIFPSQLVNCKCMSRPMLEFT